MGYAFICYEDQRSTELAVDNFNGIKIFDNIVKVNHVMDFKLPKCFTKLNSETEKLQIYKPSGPDGKGWYDNREYTNDDLVYIVDQLRNLLNKTDRQNKEIGKKEKKVEETIKGKVYMDEDQMWDSVFTKSIQMMKDKKLLDIQEKLKTLKERESRLHKKTKRT